jgi:hypothetical protein
MLREVVEKDQTTATGRIVAFDRARTFITLLVIVHHSVVNYTYFGNGDRMRWLGFDLVVLFNDSFFMAFMFLVSGLFVHDSLARRGAAGYLRHRAWRLGVPLLISIFVLIPLAYYASFLRYHLPGTTDFNFFHFWWHTLTIGPWPSGQSWFLWVLLAFDIIAVAVWSIAPRIPRAFGLLIFALRNQPVTAFVGFLIVSIVSYLPMHLAFGDGSWFEPGHYPFPIQSSRVLLYRRRYRRLLSQGRHPRGERRNRETLVHLARLCSPVLCCDPAAGLCPPQLDNGFRLATTSVENGVRPGLRDVQRRNGLHAVGDFIASDADQPETARCDAALGLRHLSPALRFHHLAAVRRLRSAVSGRRQIRHSIRRYAFHELGAHRSAAESPAAGADDLRQGSMDIAAVQPQASKLDAGAAIG